MRVVEAVEQFVFEQQLRDNPSATVETYRSILALWLGKANIEDLTPVTRESLARWRLEFAAAPAKPCHRQDLREARPNLLVQVSHSGPDDGEPDAGPAIRARAR